MFRKLLDKVGVGWIFLAIVIVIYGLLGVMNYALFEKAVLAFWNLLLKVLPVLGLVFGIMFLADLFLTPERIIKYLGEGSGIKGWVLMILGGILSTGPIYMWYPLLSDLKEKGMKNSLIATFLYNRAVKIPLLPMMIYYFGWVFVIILTTYMVVFSVINGLIVGKISR
ncbi:MAG: hypothetical protein KAW40_06145 [Candidatus Aenigmarchaeota archaeon]|nr:hypothetical protein [Candidatus Aenigmarchaeota archaeon]